MGKIVILPIGSYEQHGMLLPHDTDTVICNHIAALVAELFAETAVLPPLCYGLSPEHMGLGHTLSLRLLTYISFMQDLLNSIRQSFPECELIVLLNGHGGNQSAAAAVCSDFNYHNDRPKAIVQHVFPEETRKKAAELFGGFNAHADSVESSVYTAIQGDLKDGCYDIPGLQNGKGMLSLFPVRAFSECGVVTSEESITVNAGNGVQIIDDSVRRIREAIEDVLEKVGGDKLV